MRARGLLLRLPAVFALLLLAACAAGRQQQPVAALSPEAKREAGIQRDFAAESFYERLERLHVVGFPLLTANEPLCRQRGRTRQTLGLAAEYFNRRDSGEWFDSLRKVWGVDENTIVVVSVMPGGPAAKAGVRRGDVLQTANGVARDLSGQRVNVTQALDNLSAKGPVVLMLLRAGKPLAVTIPAPVDICETTFRVLIGDSVNAFADGRHVAATYGIMNLFAKDEDLAVVLGHELAHNILGHVRKDASGKTVRTATPETESEADAVGLYFTARAGFNIENAPNVWRRMAAQNPAHIRSGAVHPSSASRFVDLEAVRDEILMRQAAGLPLIPRPRVAPGP
ncbi:MAG: M48 family metalloprotease [Proteobacteria bacterium]|nr:M48 family metalloprotease [Pseudomonadota bacterium]MBU1595973.1 M48 family metalloprotease [Pseudomonadota bacterium]